MTKEPIAEYSSLPRNFSSHLVNETGSARTTATEEADVVETAVRALAN